jgi:hypothetical protein
VPHGLHVEPERMPVEPLGARLLIVPEWQPQVLELPDLLAVLSVSQVDDMRNSQTLEFFYVLPGGYRAAKCQPLAYPKHLHTFAPFVRT